MCSVHMYVDIITWCRADHVISRFGQSLRPHRIRVSLLRLPPAISHLTLCPILARVPYLLIAVPDVVFVFRFPLAGLFVSALVGLTPDAVYFAS